MIPSAAMIGKPKIFFLAPTPELPKREDRLSAHLYEQEVVAMMNHAFTKLGYEAPEILGFNSPYMD